MRVRRLLSLAALALAFGCKATTDTPTPTPTSITATPDPITLVSIGQTQQITASVKDQNGNTMSGQTITYGSNATGVATVSTSGLVTAVSSGTATITLSAGGLTEQVAVTVNQTANAINKTQGDAQSGVENSALPTQLRATVVDALGNAVAGVTVTFTIQGGGTLNDSTVNTNAQGHALVTWTLGSSANNQSVTATAGALNTTFTATAVSASSLVITKYVGDGQTALVGYATNIRPAVRVTNFGGSAVPGINVTFAVTGGGGGITGSTTIATNAQGIAQVQNWVVGGSAGANMMTATGAGTYPGGATVTFNATAQTAQYKIEIRNVGPAFAPAVQAAFDSAEAYWERAIYGDLPNVGTGARTDVCGFGVNMNETIDDIIILAKFDSIDGPGLILGSAGPTLVYPTSELTGVGCMRFDTADVANMVAAGTLNSVIRHEMGHVLGFNSFTFNAGGRSCAQSLSSGNPPSVVSNDTHFNCAIARASFDSIGGTAYTGGQRVPLENCASGVPASCGQGNYNGHWREATFDNEMMTPYLDPTMPLSILTLAVFEDLGYRVNFGVSQPYTRVFTAPAATRDPGHDLGDDEMRLPIYVLDGRGGVSRVILPRP